MEEAKKYEVVKKEEPMLSVADVKKFIAPNASEKELFMFMNIAKSYGLNPFKREIHFVKYGTNPASVIVGYESYIKRAEQTGKLDGWKVWIADMGKPEERAIIEIRRKDFSQPFVWEVYRKEFDSKQANWNRMPSFMLKKVAIAQGFRLAFPSEIGGMPYIPEELPVEKVGTSSSENLPKAEEHREDIPEPEELQDKTAIIDDLKKKIAGKMRGFSPQEKKAFFDYVMKGVVTVDKLNHFNENFDECRDGFMASRIPKERA